jgi:hypothetical protein
MVQYRYKKERSSKVIDPLITLAFTLHSKKGAYALMLGSGISRSAGIPTGWEITLKIINDVALLSGENSEHDPAGWYIDRYGAEPDYGELLNMLYKSPTERSQYLRNFFEPTEEEFQQGIKIPTVAHRAIAKLVKNGVIRVIVTTNFDRLLEKALEEIGIYPTIISNEDSLKGALPYVHSDCTLIKLHGDYLDTRIKNTGTELESYHESMNGLLDRILDEFGIITCGWSAAWDTALRAAFERCGSHRFSTYWTTIGDLNEHASRLVGQRKAEVIQIHSADIFFSTLEEMVTGLDEVQRPHPLSSKVAVANLKKFITDERHIIKLNDMVKEETRRVIESFQGDDFSIDSTFTAEEFAKRLEKYEAHSEVIISLFASGAYWGKPVQEHIWANCLEWLSEDKYSAGLVAWIELQRYPALLVTYAGGIASVAANQLNNLKALLLKASVVNNHRISKEMAAVFSILPIRIFDERGKYIPEMERRKTPVSDHLFRVLREPLRDIIPRDSEFEKYFVRFEYYLSLIHADFYEVEYNRFWGPIGQFGWRSSDDNILQVLSREIEEKGDSHPLILAGFFNGSVDRLKKVKEEMDKLIYNLGWMF